MKVLTFRCDRVHLGEPCIIPWGLTEKEVIQQQIVLKCYDCEHFIEISTSIPYKSFPPEEIKKCQDRIKNTLG